MPTCTTEAKKEVKTCPECGARVRFITTENGSNIPVDLTPVVLWVHKGNYPAPIYHNKAGLRSHMYSCTGRNKRHK